MLASFTATTETSAATAERRYNNGLVLQNFDLETSNVKQGNSWQDFPHFGLRLSLYLPT